MTLVTAKSLDQQDDGRSEWIIGVKTDGKKWWGYAESMCIQLNEFNAVKEGYWVKIVDYKKFMATGSHSAATLGAVRCSDGTHFD